MKLGVTHIPEVLVIIPIVIEHHHLHLPEIVLNSALLVLLQTVHQQ